jgi:hypothetical protein
MKKLMLLAVLLAMLALAAIPAIAQVSQESEQEAESDFEFDEVNSSIDLSPESSTTCDQQVNQAASASG